MVARARVCVSLCMCVCVRESSRARVCVRASACVSLEVCSGVLLAREPLPGSCPRCTRSADWGQCKVIDTTPLPLPSASRSRRSRVSARRCRFCKVSCGWGCSAYRELFQVLISQHSVNSFLFCWLLNVPATCECISGTDLLRQFHVLPH